MTVQWQYYEVSLRVSWARGAKTYKASIVTCVHAESGGHAIARVAGDLPDALDVEDAVVEAKGA